MQPHQSQVRKIALAFLLVIGGVALSPLGYSIILWLQVSPLPRAFGGIIGFLLAVSFLLPLIMLGMAIVAPVTTIGYAMQKRRWWIPWALVWALNWYGWATLRTRDSDAWRRPGLVRITQNAKPLIAAIENYKTATGAYPPNLAALTPRFIAQIPYTGAPAYPEFRYAVGRNTGQIRNYELLVRTPKGGFNWDVFFYWPEKKYPEHIYGGGVEKIGAWAYVHE